jgi:hypothetical protein
VSSPVADCFNLEGNGIVGVPGVAQSLCLLLCLSLSHTHTHTQAQQGARHSHQHLRTQTIVPGLSLQTGVLTRQIRMRVWMARAAFSLLACRAINVRRMRAKVPRKKHCRRTAALVARSAWPHNGDRQTHNRINSLFFLEVQRLCTKRGEPAQITDGLCDEGVRVQDRWSSEAKKNGN